MRPIARFLLLLLPFLLSSCFEIMEEVNMHSSTNGHYILTVNMSQSKFQLDKILAQDTFFGINVPSRQEIEHTFSTVTNQVKSTKGITNVVLSKDYTNYIFKLDFDFANAKSLNNAINKVWKTYDRRADTSTVHYIAQPGSFKKTPNDNLLAPYRNRMGLRDREMLSSSSYTCIYRFPHEVKSISNAIATVSKSKKAVLLKATLLDIVLGKKTIQNDIILITP